jgi:HEAT repeat protein
MDKLVEREASPRNALSAAPALAVQFFLIPLAVVGITILVYLGFRMMLLGDERSAQEYLTEIRYGGANRRWPAAYELSRLMADPKVRARDQTLAPALTEAFEHSKDDDPRVRRYLALALGRLDRPMPPRAQELLIKALDDPDSETRISAIWALGSAGDAAVEPAIDRMYGSDDAGIRKMTVYALGALPGEAAVPTLRSALNDTVADVQWNAAVALARKGQHEGVPVIQRMLDRSYVKQAVRIPSRPDMDVDPVADVMISGLQAAAALKDERLRGIVSTVSREDESLRVRQAALDALKMMQPL